MAALAAIVTPPDPGSQIILAVPLLLLFEGSLLLMRLQEKFMPVSAGDRSDNEEAAEGEQESSTEQPAE